MYLIDKILPQNILNNFLDMKNEEIILAGLITP